MTLPNQNITPIPNNEPDAVPSLWNTRYEEIDQNFADLDNRQTAVEQELESAAGDSGSLPNRLAGMDQRIGSQDHDYQNALHYFVRDLLERSALADTELRKTLRYRHQSGQIELANRGVVSGLSVTKSTNAARNLNLAAGVLFLKGRRFSVRERLNAASVPPNPGATNQTCTVYLRENAAAVEGIEFGVTMLGVDAPADALALYRITVPAGNTSSVDPSLDSVSMTDVRRVEASFPAVLNSPASILVALPYSLPNDGYRLTLDALSATGAPLPSDALSISARASNGFRVTLASAADAVVLRWSINLMEI
jgi:hypothetical protein